MKTLLSFTWMLASVGALYADKKDQVGVLIKQLADKDAFVRVDAAAALSKQTERESSCPTCRPDCQQER
jgi:HEAT repeat protein